MKDITRYSQKNEVETREETEQLYNNNDNNEIAQTLVENASIEELIYGDYQFYERLRYANFTEEEMSNMFIERIETNSIEASELLVLCSYICDKDVAEIKNLLAEDEGLKKLAIKKINYYNETQENLCSQDYLTTFNNLLEKSEYLKNISSYEGLEDFRGECRKNYNSQEFEMRGGIRKKIDGEVIDQHFFNCNIYNALHKIKSGYDAFEYMHPTNSCGASNFYYEKKNCLDYLEYLIDNKPSLLKALDQYCDDLSGKEGPAKKQIKELIEGLENLKCEAKKQKTQDDQQIERFQPQEQDQDQRIERFNPQPQDQDQRIERFNPQPQDQQVERFQPQEQKQPFQLNRFDEQPQEQQVKRLQPQDQQIERFQLNRFDEQPQDQDQDQQVEQQDSSSSYDGQLQ